MSDQQDNTARDEWRKADGKIVYLDDMPDMFVVNAYWTCKRYGMDKADDVFAELERREIDWMLAAYPREVGANG